jgi:ribosomal protein S24E
LGVSSSALLLAGGELSEHYYHYPKDCNTEVLWLHALDYDLYLEENCKPFLHDVSGNAVFLDSYMPYHPDFIILGENNPVSPERYFPSINKFFNLIEQEQSLKVVIAAHPSADYSNKPSSYGNRMIYYGKTIGCVRSAKFIIAHSSTALNFAVLYRKPIIFIFTNEMSKAKEAIFIDDFASWFGKKPINIDVPYSIDWKQELTVDEKKYIVYQNTFIKKANTKEEYIWQTLVNKLKDM